MMSSASSRVWSLTGSGLVVLVLVSVVWGLVSVGSVLVSAKDIAFRTCPEVSGSLLFLLPPISLKQNGRRRPPRLSLTQRTVLA